jgi:hypothetical protein
MPNLLDANGVAYFQRNLEVVKSRVFEVKYPELTFRKIFPVDNSVNPGAASVIAQHYGVAGSAKVISGSAHDLPRVDVHGGETIYPVKMVADSFSYTIKEIKSAQMAGIPLNQKKANAARYIIEKTLNDIAFNGYASANLVGLFSDTNVPQGDMPNGNWASASADDIVEDIIDALTQVYTDSNGVEVPDSLLVTPEAFSLLTSKQRSVASDKTIFAWLIENVPYFNGNRNAIVPCPDCVGAGDENDDVIVAMARNSEKLEMCIPEEINFLPEQEQGLEFVIPVYAQTAGLHIYYPGSIFISEGC